MVKKSRKYEIFLLKYSSRPFEDNVIVPAINAKLRSVRGSGFPCGPRTTAFSPL